jgi:hypothetical protein
MNPRAEDAPNREKVRLRVGRNAHPAGGITAVSTLDERALVTEKMDRYQDLETMNDKQGEAI